jgi:hypothetical protein
VDNGKISLLISVEQPSAGESEKSRKPTLMEKVNYAIDCLQGDYNTDRAIAYIAKVYEYICKVPEEDQTPIQKKVMRMIIPEMEFFVPHLLDSKSYMEYKEDRDQSDTPKIKPDYLRGR